MVADRPGSVNRRAAGIARDQVYITNAGLVAGQLNE
jgi:hypothetical protein